MCVYVDRENFCFNFKHVDAMMIKTKHKKEGGMHFVALFIIVTILR